MGLEGAVVLFAEGHATAGGPENSRLGPKVGIKAERFPKRGGNHVGGAMEPGVVSAAKGTGGEEALIVQLAGGLAAGLADGKAGHWGDAVSRKFNGLSRFRQTDAQGADHSHGYDGHPFGALLLVAKCHLSVKLWGAAIPVAFLFEGPYKWRNGIGSLEVGGLSVEFIQRRFEIR